MLRMVDRMSAGSMGVMLDYFGELFGFHSLASCWPTLMSFECIFLATDSWFESIRTC